MRIVQTFFNACHAGRSGGAERWTAGHNPLEYGFFNTCYAGRSGRAERGWPHAEYRSACRFAFSAKNCCEA